MELDERAPCRWDLFHPSRSQEFNVYLDNGVSNCLEENPSKWGYVEFLIEAPPATTYFNNPFFFFIPLLFLFFFLMGEEEGERRRRGRRSGGGEGEEERGGGEHRHANSTIMANRTIMLKAPSCQSTIMASSGDSTSGNI